MTIEDARLEGFEATTDGLENLQTELNLALYNKYEEDVAAFKAAQNKKLVDSAGIMASIREQFSTGLDSTIDGDEGGFFQNFFDFDVNSITDKISQMESTYISALDIQNLRKMKRFGCLKNWALSLAKNKQILKKKVK